MSRKKTSRTGPVPVEGDNMGALALVEDNLDSEPHPTVRIQAGNLHGLVRKATELIAAPSAGVYQRAGELVRVVSVARHDASKARPAGTPEIRTVHPATLRCILSESATWEKFDERSDKWKAAGVPKDVVESLHRNAMWEGVRALVGVSETPIFRMDGTIAQSPGFDSSSGYVFAPGVTFPSIPILPTAEDSARALDKLRDVFDFPLKSQVDVDALIAALLSLLARPAIGGSIPGLVIDANLRAAGKSRISDILAIIATGRPCPRSGYPEDEDALSKALFSHAIRGSRLLSLDNVSRTVEGAAIDMYLTSETVSERVLGVSEIGDVQWCALLMVTGNNVAIGRDSRRRFMVARIESQEENPEFRTDFRHPDILGWVARERPALVCAALTILRAYVVAGRPPMADKPVGSFEPWDRVVRQALLFAGGSDVVEAFPSASDDGDTERGTLHALLTGLRRWLESTNSIGETAKNLCEALFPVRQLGDPPIGKDGWEDLRAALADLAPPRREGDPLDSRKLAYAMRKHRGRPVNGLRLEATADRNGVAKWSVVGEPKR